MKELQYIIDNFDNQNLYRPGIILYDIPGSITKTNFIWKYLGQSFKMDFIGGFFGVSLKEEYITP